MNREEFNELLDTDLKMVYPEYVIPPGRQAILFQRLEPWAIVSIRAQITAYVSEHPDENRTPKALWTYVLNKLAGVPTENEHYRPADAAFTESERASIIKALKQAPRRAGGQHAKRFFESNPTISDHQLFSRWLRSIGYYETEHGRCHDGIRYWAERGISPTDAEYHDEGRRLWKAGLPSLRAPGEQGLDASLPPEGQHASDHDGVQPEEAEVLGEPHQVDRREGL